MKEALGAYTGLLLEPAISSSFGGMLSCLVITPSAVAAVLPTAVPLQQQPRPFVSAGEKETTGCSSMACEIISVSTGQGGRRRCDGVPERDG